MCNNNGGNSLFNRRGKESRRRGEGEEREKETPTELGGGEREQEVEHIFPTLRFSKNSSKLIVPLPSLSNFAKSSLASYRVIIEYHM